MSSNVLENRFKLEDSLAKGVGGGVFRANDLQTGQTVAVKLLYTPPGADRNFGVRFKREADVLFEISHPNIVKILHSGVTGDGVIYYAMEFISGVTLDRYVNARGRIPVGEAAEFLEQIASALDAIHARKIVHRDVTPSNIMIETDAAGRNRAKLIDFGFAKELGMNSSSKGGPATGRLLLGVAAYMSPETLAGKPATPASDVHALGVTLMIALTGKHPFLRESEVGTIAAVLEEQPPTLRALAPDATFPAGVEALVAKALAKKPQLRPASAGEFAKGFRELVAMTVPSPARRQAANGADDDAASAMPPAATRPTNGADSGRLRRGPSTDPSPSGRLLMHAVREATEPSPSRISKPKATVPTRSRQSAAWAAPLLGILLVLGGVYALVNLMAI